MSEWMWLTKSCRGFAIASEHTCGIGVSFDLGRMNFEKLCRKKGTKLGGTPAAQ